MADCCMVFFRPGACYLDTAERALRGRGFQLSVQRDGDGLVVGSSSRPEFRVVCATDRYVREEAEEIGVGSPYAEAMRECGHRFEVLINDLDGALNEINSLIEVQATLQQVSNGYLFLAWNGKLMPPEPNEE